ncbi:MAG TPA: hypothetical protein PLK40_06470 [Bacteroidaceae bacterium]|nr:hypothetical protein [Bacteroidaceae bacterium]
MKPNDFLEDQMDDQQTIQFIRNYLSPEIHEKYDDDTLVYILDLVDEYYTESGILESSPDDEGFVEIDLEQIVDYVVKEIAKDKLQKPLDPEEVLLIIQAELEYAESLED